MGKTAAILRDVLEEILEERLTFPVPVNRQGGRSVAFRTIRRNGEPVIVKLTDGRNSYPTEKWVYREFRHAGIPAPEVYYYCPELPRLSLPCLVLSEVPGAPIFARRNDPPESFGGYEAIGALLGQIHRISLPYLRFGHGAFLESQGTGHERSWAEFIMEYQAYPASCRILAEMDSYFWKSRDLEKLGSSIESHSFAPVLNHGDYGPDHIFFNKGRIAGVIDAGEAFVGPAEYDLAYLACYIPEPQLGRILRRYDCPVDPHMFFVYLAVIAMDKAARAHVDGRVRRADAFLNIMKSALPRCVFQSRRTKIARFPSSTTLFADFF